MREDAGEEDLPRLVRRAQDGEREAFDRLYELYVGRVHALCLRMAADAAHAETLTQDVFVLMWQKLATYRGESDFYFWLRRLAINVVLGERRAEWRRSARVELTDDLSRFERPVASVEPETRLDLEQAVAKLPPGARTVLVLHDIEGYRHEEIARMTGTAVGTMKAQLHRARRLLREALER